MQYDPHWWEIFANRIRILRSLGTREEIEHFSNNMRVTRTDSYDAALKYADANDSTIPRLQHRLVHSLMDYVSLTAGHRRWLAVEGWLSARQGEPIQDVESRFADDSLDVVFIDGDHRYEAVVRDLRIARRAVKPGGVVAVHDYGNRAGVAQAVDELKLPFKQIETLVILENV